MFVSNPVHSFLNGQSGAVSVDFVILTAGLVGTALAVTGGISGGLSYQGGALGDRLGDYDLVDTFDQIADSTDFSNGRGDWVGGEIITTSGFGEILALSRNAPFATLPVNVGSEFSYAKVDFDMIIGDSWDNETGTISFGGTDVVLTQHNWRNDAPEVQTFDGTGGTSVTLTRVSTQTGGRWRPGVEDFTYRVSVVARNGTDLELGAETTLNQRASDEFFGIDNVVVTGSDTRG